MRMVAGLYVQLGDRTTGPEAQFDFVEDDHPSGAAGVDDQIPSTDRGGLNFGLSLGLGWKVA
jgi:hypothetical protein